MEMTFFEICGGSDISRPKVKKELGVRCMNENLRDFRNTQVVVVWVVSPCSDVVGYQLFGSPCCLHLHPEDGSSPKRWYPSTLPHGVTTYITTTLIFIALKTSDLTSELNWLDNLGRNGRCFTPQ
jgi:hypothetical protein